MPIATYGIKNRKFCSDNFADPQTVHTPPLSRLEARRWVFKVAAIWLQVLPDDGSVPGMPGWRWLHTSGHATGHVLLWRESDRAIIAGDAFITTRMESAYAVTVQKPEMHGPPMYFTTDFKAAKRSVQMLAKLEPELAVTGHGRAMHGPEMRTALHLLAENFDHYAVPKNGRYVKAPAIAADGTAYRQP